MRTLRFHNEIYFSEALDRTEEVFREHAGIEREYREPYSIVVLRAVETGSEEELAGEFANYALALTAEQRKAAN